MAYARQNEKFQWSAPTSQSKTRNHVINHGRIRVAKIHEDLFPKKKSFALKYSLEVVWQPVVEGFFLLT
jgi:hypothetical protein